MPKHVGVLIITMNCILLSTVVGASDDDRRNVHGINNNIKNCSVYTSQRQLQVPINLLPGGLVGPRAVLDKTTVENQTPVVRTATHLNQLY